MPESEDRIIRREVDKNNAIRNVLKSVDSLGKESDGRLEPVTEDEISSLHKKVTDGLINQLGISLR